MWIGTAALTGSVAFVAPLEAQAEGLWDRVKDVYHMPETVDKLEEQLSESIRASEEAAEQFRETQSALMEENEALRRSNEALEARLLSAEATIEEQRAAGARWTRILMTAAALLLLYFALARLLRFFVWRRHRDAAKDGSA
jgi:regulator of replication initiation timing